METPIRVGVIGVRRGMSFARGAAHAGLELVATCDKWEEKLAEANEELGIATYTDYDEFLTHDMDAVILANYFHQHAPFAIKALKAGKHVMSETACNSTLAEGVALCRAVEDSGCIYMLAENYVFTAFSMEMARLYQAGEVGEVTYAEGEYNHPMSDHTYLSIAPGKHHWRNWLPPTYYCTHALAPLMAITETIPMQVNGLSIPRPELIANTAKRSDPGCVILCRMDNGAVFRIMGLFMPGHSNWYRVHGNRGAMEITRGPGYFGPGQIRIWHEEWDCRPGEPTERSYVPDWPEHADLARATGHGGGDFWTNYRFAEAIRSGEQPFLNVYRGVAMSSVGILAWRSALEDGRPVAVPDFSDEAARAPYADDDWSPWPEGPGNGEAPSSILGRREPTAEGLAYARQMWDEIGYAGE